MKRCVASLLLSFACAPALMTHRFVKTDESFQPASREELSKVLIDWEDVGLEPPFKTVGVVEVLGKETDKLDDFLTKVSRVGRRYGCDVVVQRDAYQLGNHMRLPWAPGRQWVANGSAAWQFLCGIKGADLALASTSMGAASAVAGKLRDEELGANVCEAPIGARGTRRTSFCVSDPKNKH
jgi:hypothetical protein